MSLQPGLVAALRRQAAAMHVSGVAAGLHAVLELPAGQDEDQVVISRGPALVVGDATAPDHAFTAALARLCAVLTSS